MAIQDIIILGAGPCGLSTAIALAKITPTPRITIIELRREPQPMGGTINMTPLAIRYLDYLGAGQRLRDRSIALVDGVDMISLRTGWKMGNIWGGIGCRRTARFPLVVSLLETAKQEHADAIEIQWGRRVTGIDEVDDKVVLTFDDRSTMRGDVLFGCDGIHSAARSLWVEPGRDKIYSGRAVTMGWYNAAPRKDEELKQTAAPITYLNGKPAIRDTAVFNGHGGVLITSYFEPTRQNIFFAHVREMDEPTDAGRDGWQVLGKDQHAVRQEVVRTYEGGRVNGLEAAISGCDSWHQYPIYKLPPGGRWHRGRVLLLGDAAHAVSFLPLLSIVKMNHSDH